MRLTRHQQALLAFVEGYRAMRGRSPTLETIAAAMGVSAVSTVHEHVENLCRKGVLMRVGTGPNRQLIPSRGDYRGEPLDLERLKALRAEAEATPVEDMRVDEWPCVVHQYRDALQAAAPALLSACEERDRLRARVLYLETKDRQYDYLRDRDLILTALESGPQHEYLDGKTMGMVLYEARGRADGTSRVKEREP